MKRTLLSLLALFFPWVAFLIIGKPLAALAALALQLTFVGWLPAGFWAWTEIRLAYAKDELLRPAQQATNPPENMHQNEIEKPIDPSTPSDAQKTIHQDEPPLS